MEIIASDQFLNSAREKPIEALRVIRRLASGQGEAPARVEFLWDQKALGWSRQPDQLALHFLAPASGVPVLDAAPPLASLSKAALRELGVEDALIRAVQLARSRDELERLELPNEVRGKVLFQWLQLSAGAGTDLKRRAEGVEHLERYLKGDIADLLLNLDGDQRHIVDIDSAGPIVIKGVAGSGKTSLILHRIHRIVSETAELAPPTVLVLTYNSALSLAALELLKRLGVRPDSVTVSTVHAWCRKFLGLRAMPDDRVQEQALKFAKKTVQSLSPRSTLWTYPDQFWKDEIHLIKGRVQGGVAEYLDMERAGAGRPLARDLRQRVWTVLEGYDAFLRRRNTLDWDDVVARAFKRHESMGAAGPRFDYVFVDEAQDLTAIAMRLAARLVSDARNVLVSFDPAQSIYERGFRLKRCGISVHSSRSFRLSRNHRNTRQILEAARQLLGSLNLGSDDEDEALIDPEAPPRDGPAPRVIETGPHREVEVVAADIKRLIAEEQVPPANIAVLCYPNPVRDEVYAQLRLLGVSCQEHDRDGRNYSHIRLQDPAVKVLPIKSAKGLEFPVVYVLASERLFVPPKKFETGPELEIWRDQMRSTLYMGLTRAMDTLVIVHEEGKLTELLKVASPPSPTLVADLEVRTDTPQRERRAASDKHRFIVLPNPKLVMDRDTKLIWQRDVPSAAFTFEKAREYARTLDLEGGGWRLPTQEELMTLVQRGWSPAIDRRVFRKTPAWWFWTNRREPSNFDLAWALNFATREARTCIVSSAFHVRCVRSAESVVGTR